jgi:hypothetical protein
MMVLSSSTLGQMQDGQLFQIDTKGDDHSASYSRPARITLA